MSRLIKIGGDLIGEVESLKYLGSFVQKNGNVGMDVKLRIKFGWMKWREALSELCDKKIPMRLKGKFYKSVLIPTMLYSSECWIVNRRIEQSMSVVEWEWIDHRIHLMVREPHLQHLKIFYFPLRYNSNTDNPV